MITTASYVIKQYNGYTGAINGTGEIEFIGTNSSIVIQNAINALTNGGKIFIKAGTHTISNTINIPYDNIYIQGEGDATLLKANTTNDLITLSIPNGSTELNRTIIRDMSIYGKWNGGDIITSRSTLARGLNTRINMFLFDNLYISYIPPNKYGIAILNPDNAQISNCFLKAGQNGGNGTLLESDGHASGAIRLYSNMFTSGKNDTIGLHLKQTVGSMRRIECFGNHFWSQQSNIGNTAVKIERCCQLLNFVGCNAEDHKICFDIIGAGTSYPWNPTQIIISGCHIFHRRSSSAEDGQVGIRLDKMTSNCQVLSSYFEGTSGIGTTKGIVDDNIAGAPNIFENNEFKYITIPMILSTKSRARGNFGYMTENRGTFITNGTGTQYQFRMAHGLASIPVYVRLEAKSSDAAISKYWVADIYDIIVNFVTPPPSGINNIVISWEAGMANG